MSLQSESNINDLSKAVYTDTGLSYAKESYSTKANTDWKIVEKVEVAIKALGTMIIIPEYETGDDFIKRYTGGIQKPILEGGNREEAINVLMQLISQL